jgi:DNA polymerase I
MTGFFTKRETQSVLRPDGKSRSCHSCGLFRKVNSPMMKPYGEFRKGILNIGEAPGELEDARGEPWQGKAGRTLQKMYKELGVDLFEDCLNINAVSCRPMTKKGTNRTPTSYEIECCRRRVLQVIAERKPKIIVLLGNTAIESVLGHRWMKGAIGGINKWRGWTIPDQDFKAWICPVFHPSFIMRSNADELITVWKNDLERAFAKLDSRFPVYKEPNIKYISDLSELNEIENEETIDYETTGLKPQAEGHEIICCSVATNENDVYVFMMPEDPSQRQYYIRTLTNRRIKKMAHNMRFEHEWSKEILGATVKNWYWDSMLAAHVLDNRGGISGLKFQTYVNFGIIDYSSDVDKWLSAVESKNGNSLNRIKELIQTNSGRQKLMKYCAKDSTHQYRLAMKQINSMSPEDKEAYDLLHEGVLALTRAEQQGIRIDSKEVEKQERKIERKIRTQEKEFLESDFAKDWEKSSKKTLNIYSPQQLSDFLYKTKRLKPHKTTSGGRQGSTGEDALEKLNIPDLNLLVQLKQLKKVKNTYLSSLKREAVNGYIHPFFNLHIARTYRSSSDSPNFQNIPIRNKELGGIIRGVIYPRPGHQLMEVDYGQLEGRIAACYSEDENLIKDVLEGDVHAEWCMKVFKFAGYDASNPHHKLLRSATKNGFFFPELYGSWYKNCAEGLACEWGKLSKSFWGRGEGIKFRDANLSDHFRNEGIRSFDDFTENVKQVEREFWRKYYMYKEWKERLWKDYQTHGFIRTKTGFALRGVMDLRKVINSPIQGSAFHCLLWSFIQITKAQMREHWDTVPVGQIHDSIVFDVNPNELSNVVNIVECIMCNDVRQHWPWIVTPLEVDFELSPVDKSWAEKKPYEH